VGLPRELFPRREAPHFEQEGFEGLFAIGHGGEDIAVI
jgi:hypothetical protein